MALIWPIKVSMCQVLYFYPHVCIMVLGFYILTNYANFVALCLSTDAIICKMSCDCSRFLVKFPSESAHLYRDSSLIFQLVILSPCFWYTLWNAFQSWIINSAIIIMYVLNNCVTATNQLWQTTLMIQQPLWLKTYILFVLPDFPTNILYGLELIVLHS